MFEIHVGELRATFLRNHNMRRHKDPSGRQPKQTTQAQKTPATPTAATSTGALHPLRGGAPVTWRCTRTEEVHCLRIGCSAPTHKNKRGTGTPNHSPPHPSMRTWTLLAAGWARRPRRPRHHLHSGPLRPTPTPPTPLHAKSRERRGTSGGPATSREALRTAGCGPGFGQRALAYRSTECPDAAEVRMASTTRRLSRASSMVTCSAPTPRIASRKRSCSRARGSRLVRA